MTKPALLVIGSSGFVGSHFYQRAKNKDFTNIVGTHNKQQQTNQLSLKYDLNLGKPNIHLTPLLTTCKYSHESTLPSSSKVAIIFASISSIDQCAKDPVGTHTVNVLNTIETIKELAEIGYKIIFISTDHVFDGSSGNYCESDPTNPVNEYGEHKALVEEYLTRQLPNSLVIRLSKVCAPYQHPKNLFTDWQSSCEQGHVIKCIEDQHFCPTSVDDIARGILSLINLNSCGIFHLSAASWSRLALAELFANKIGVKTVVVEQALEKFQLPGVRPINTTLNNEKFISTCQWQFESMQSTVQKYCSSVRSTLETTKTVRTI